MKISCKTNIGKKTTNDVMKHIRHIRENTATASSDSSEFKYFIWTDNKSSNDGEKGMNDFLDDWGIFRVNVTTAFKELR
jgi:hypothetical protein